MRTKVTLGRHPVHPMVVGFPVAFYTATVVCMVAYAFGADPFWFQAALVANVAGVATAAVAAVPGFLDWAWAVPPGSPAKRTGLWHMLANVAALILFGASALIDRGEWGMTEPVLHASALTLCFVGLFLTGVAGYLGWKMVQTHHVGVELTPEQEQLEPRASAGDRTPLTHG